MGSSQCCDISQLSDTSESEYEKTFEQDSGLPWSRTQVEKTWSSEELRPTLEQDSGRKDLELRGAQAYLGAGLW